MHLWVVALSASWTPPRGVHAFARGGTVLSHGLHSQRVGSVLAETVSVSRNTPLKGVITPTARTSVDDLDAEQTKMKERLAAAASATGGAAAPPAASSHADHDAD